MIYKEEALLQGIAENLYQSGYDVDVELMGAKLKDIGKKIVSKVKRIKKKGGVSITTPGGSAQIGPQSLPVTTEPVNVMDKLKEPKTIAMIAGAGIILYMISKKRRK